MHVLITGHTGFKGAWLAMLLKERKHNVSGISLDPIKNSLFESAEIQDIFEHDKRIDIRNSALLEDAFKAVSPDVVIHMAAQPLVRESYRDPVTTYDTNIQGTLNVLKATSKTKTVKAQLIITTDKVYKNVNKREGYVESEILGGHDPYSSSKAIADLLTQAWVRSIKSCPTAIARAGNVIGGGDVSSERLIPDLINSYSNNLVPALRFPNAVRPWQHVLDCLNGYLILVDKLLTGSGKGAWNFGPAENEIRTVAEVSDLVGKIWGVEKSWIKDNGDHPHEAGLLNLNSSKARSQLHWKDKLGFEESVRWTTDWYKDVYSGLSPMEATKRNIENFESIK